MSEPSHEDDLLVDARNEAHEHYQPQIDELIKENNELTAKLKAAERHIWRFGGGTNHAYIATLEAALTEFLLWNGADFPNDEDREYALVGICERAYQLVPASASDTPPREVGCIGPDDLVRVHSESETCDVCSAPQTKVDQPTKENDDG